MNIGIGSDHRGFEQKEFIKKNFSSFSGEDIFFVDVGCKSEDLCDYPKFAKMVVDQLNKKKVEVGILLCATGVGMSIAANRFNGIYAGLAWNEKVAQLNKKHDNVNILVLPSDFISNEQALSMIKIWIDSKFIGERYQKRIEMIDNFNKI